jgi:para-nitrobenzyl esterase
MGSRFSRRVHLLAVRGSRIPLNSGAAEQRSVSPINGPGNRNKEAVWRRRILQFSSLLVVFLLFFNSSAGSSAEQDPTVHLASGSVRGKFGGTFAVFQGIPYAAPPVGALRWKEPQPVATWTGVRDATKPGSACVQDVAGVGHFMAPLAAAYGAPFEIQPVSSSEDCLYLNVWLPEWPSKTGRLPVMVWLHGGSNRVGNGAETTYNGTSLVSHGVIVVTINYRLGVMGFFSHRELTNESAHHSSGNYGLLDQIAALLWVKQNIASFGGDPGNVTLFGESAGSIDAMTLITSPLSNGLFRRVIAESGPAFGLGPARTIAEAQKVGDAVAMATGGTSTSALENLRKLPAVEVVKLDERVVKAQFRGFPTSAAITEGWFLPQSPERAFALGQIQKVDLLVGLNGREVSAFRVGAAAAAKTAGKPENSGGPGEIIETMAAAVHPLYGSWTDVALSVYIAKMIVHRDAAIDQASNDMLLACPVGAEAALTTAAGQHAFIYRFDRSVPGQGEATLGAFHSIEIPYVFNAFQDHSWTWLPTSETDLKLSRTIETYWTNFAKNGDPNSPGLATWPFWTYASEPYLEFNQNGDAIPQQSFSPIFCHLSPDRLKQQLSIEPAQKEQPKKRSN